MKLSSILSLVLFGASAAVSAQETQSLYDLLTAPNNPWGVSTFVSLLSSDPSYEPIIDALKNPGNLTCFVPSDKAMEDALDDYQDYLKKNRLTASGTFPSANTTFGNLSVLDYVKYHIVNDSVELSNLPDYVTILNTTANDLPLLVSNNARWRNFMNETWLNTHRDALEFDVGNGEDDVDVAHKDIKASNGYLNIIDEVLIPPTTPNLTIARNDETVILSKVLLTHPEVIDYLDSLSNFTLLAPSDYALKDFSYAPLSNDTVKTLLMSHIINGTLTSIDFPQGNSTVTNLNNQDIPVTMDGPIIRFNNTALVKEKDILFNNGIMHIINKVLDPPTTA